MDDVEKPWTAANERAAIVAFLYGEAEARLADECERDAEVLTEAASALERGEHTETGA